MKKTNLLVLLASLAMLVSSCGNSGDSSPSDPPLPEGDGYVDALPDKMDDGVFLQAFNWTYNQVYENLPLLAGNGYRGVQISPVQVVKQNGSTWYYFYQPLSFTVADNSALGTKAELRQLCDEAEKYGMAIIVDVVANHMATPGTKDSRGIPIVDPAVQAYEPELYNNQSEYFHQIPLNECVGSGKVTQYYQYSVLPDLNTGNAYVQERVLSFLKECIDIGVDGFRFDAAKHIETPRDPNYPSDFWPNTLGVAREYYREKTGDELFAYGEILGSLDGGRTDLTMYTDYMKITDDSYIGRIDMSIDTDASLLKNATFSRNTNPNNLITWIFSHDSYSTTTSDDETFAKYMARRWAVLASRNGSNPMMLARPDAAKTVGKISYYDFESELYANINRFHNRFVGSNEDIHQSGDTNVYVAERYNDVTQGAVLVEVATKRGSTKNVSFNHLADGDYIDQMTNKLVTVKDGKGTVTFNDCGVAVLTKSNNSRRPSISVSQKSTTFQGSITVTINTKNAESAYYQLNDGLKINFSGSKSVTISSDGTTKLLIHVENGGQSVERFYLYKKISIIGTGFNIVNLDPSILTSYELYYWAWPTGGSGKWYKDYQVIDGNVIIDFPTNLSKFLLAIFPKGYVISNVNAWDNKCVAQTPDIDISDGVYDASGFKA